MQIIKYLMLVIILIFCTYIGILISQRYSNRVKDLKEMKTALNIFSTKVKLTYEPIPQIFKEISKKMKKEISDIFMKASSNMEYMQAGDAWIKSLEVSNTNMNKDDIEVLKGLSNLLGKVDIEGQVSEIELIDTFLNSQIEKAEEERKKNEKMYKTLGITVGLVITIILF